VNGRDPRQEPATAPTDPAIFSYERGAQMALLPELETLPELPRTGTLARRLLRMLADGAEVTHPDFQAATGSWRAAAVVFELGLLGWRIDRVHAPKPTRSDRYVAVYSLSPRQRAIAEEVLR
jgi:hypothetical protein